MADAVPVCDVLSEAMEYLSRLGSNLRVRSENFKQKKLRKERLRNTHAVQKAANKVLLICELSKKSILNVEDGVKKILTQIDAAQGSSKHNKNINENIKEIKYEYFEYNSQKLKIRSKINLQHFTSAKVCAKAMPLAMQDKYPLYYVCKLYHLREKRNESTHDNLNEDISLKNNEDEVLISNNFLEKTEQLEKDSNTISTDIPDKSNNIDERESTPEKQNSSFGIGEKKQKSISKKNRKFKHIKVMDSSSDSNDCSEANLQINNNCVEDNDAAKTASGDESSKNKDNNIKEQHPLKSPIETASDELNHVPEREVTSETLKANISESQEEKQDEGSVSVDTIDNRETSVLNKSEVNKENQVLSNSDSEKLNLFAKDTNEPESEINNTNTDAEECANLSLPNDLKTVSNDASNINDVTKDSITESKLISEDNSQSSTDSRPLIKCVNINKLLKQDKVQNTRESLIEILDSDTDGENTKTYKKLKHNKDSKKSLSKRKTKFSKKSANDSKTNRDASLVVLSDDEEFWKEKRKEVKKFKPKQFTINIVRIPKISEQYLHKNSLKRITQNGSVICEISLQNIDTEQQQSTSPEPTLQSIEPEKKLLKDINVVKSVLLNDSDTDCEKNNELKKTLLNESDSENTKKRSSSLSSEENIEKTKSSESDNDKNSEKSVKKDKQDNVTQSEHESESDSSDTNNKSKKRKRKSRNSSSPLPSKRKRTMESAHAKNMLLNCSSSSDTEDELTKKVLKDIRDALLKGESDDDIEIKRKSSSDEELTKLSTGTPSRDRSNSECDISTKDTNSQVDENNEVNSNSSSEKVRN